METLKLPVVGGDRCILAQGTIIDGKIKVDADLRLEGEIKGNVDCSGKLVMSKSAIILGNVTCNELLCEGKITGNIKSKQGVILLSTAQINGDVECTHLQIDNGASFNGRCTMLKGAK